ncbi:phage scaffolding protein [Clostridium sp. D2Q-14]|uniref:phage scaffolding protein n=1 Tax=Anaeromonas gelatinilytica TaxID=2683194 RepID=UPI00193BE901|nr:phage scaffolding protein [Anaeromonas gelatinilytica]MBS4535827.1 phage scaffolding protein [Anaeromonas gelatinilytica]
MEWLKNSLKKAGIEESKVDEIVTSVNKEVPKYFMPKDKYNEVSEAKKQLESDIKERDKQLKDLGGKVKGNEDLEKQIKELQVTNKKAADDYESKIRNITLDNSIKMWLKDNNAKYEDLLSTKFDREKLTIADDGSINGLEEQGNSIKEGYKDLFTQAISGNSPNDTGDSPGGMDQIEATIKQNLGY